MTQAKLLLKKIAYSLPGIGPALADREELTSSLYVRPGHWESPIPSPHEVAADAQRIFQVSERVAGVELKTERQLALLGELCHFYSEMPFTDNPQTGLRYHFNQSWFCYSDAIFLYSMLRHLKPTRIIEVGSGWSSAIMLDVNDLHSHDTHCTFIDPNPQRLYSLLSTEDRERHTVFEKRVQDIPLPFFDTLKAGDVLFIDSSHIAKTGSDVCFLLLDVLPRLQLGVYVHIHDIFYPFEYPRNWIEEGRAYNEAYAVRAFLQYNSAFEIVLWGSYLARIYPAAFEQYPLHLKNTGGSLWLRKVA